MTERLFMINHKERSLWVGVISLPVTNCLYSQLMMDRIGKNSGKFEIQEFK